MRARLARQIPAILLVLAVASGVFVVDASVDPEPATAADGYWVVEQVQHWSCWVTSSIAAAYAWAGTGGSVAVLGLGGSGTAYAFYKACRYVLKNVFVWIETVAEVVTQHGIENNPYTGGDPSQFCIGGWCFG